jgi:hypothetical protein
MMAEMKDFDLILDDCLDRFARGETVDACLKAYPGHEDELRPALQAAAMVKKSNLFEPGTDAKTMARGRFYRAMAQKPVESRRFFLSRLAAWPVALAATAAVLLVAILGYNALQQPGISPYAPGASPQGNFVFLISDAVNAIADFESLNITIDRVGLLTSSGWIEFVPEVRTIDLTLLPGEKTQAIWRGNMPEGQYSKVFIYVSDVQGVLKASGQTVDVKRPGNKIQINTAFSIASGGVTGFTFDLTVTASGNPKNGLHYMLKSQTGESGASYVAPSVTVPDKGNPHKS